MKLNALLVFFLLSLGLSSCTQQEQNSQAIAFEVEPQPMAQKAQASPSDPATQAVDVVPPTERKIIKEGSVTFETGNSEETSQRINKIVKEHNGYITEDSQSGYEDRVEHRVTIRVQADQFDALLAAIAQGADKLINKNINARDVTEEYIDVEARLKTKQELENRYRQLLQRATKVDEILAIEREIGTLRSDIESIEGRLRYLKDRVAYSTLTVTYYENSAPVTGLGYRLGTALQNGWIWLLEFLLGVVSLWPFLLLGAGAFFLLIRYRRRRKLMKE